MSLPRWHIAVLIPACNEETLLPQCLRSVQAARARLPQGVTSDVVVAVDASTDRTWEIADRTLGRQGAALICHAGCVGRARAAAAFQALRRAPAGSHIWLANTDADCEVPENWLLQHLAAASSGAGAVAGIVDVVDFTGHQAWVEEAFRRTYLLMEDGTHPHVHGANLGVSARDYEAAGGWAPLHTAEDHDLWRRLADVGCVRRSDRGLCVTTSGRRVGRAPHGFAGALAAHNEVVQ